MLYELIIIDDEPVIRECLVEMFDWEEMGFHIAGTFPDGRDALAYIDEHPVDLIISDIRMTFVTGLAVAEYVSRNKLDIKVVLMSAYEEFEYAKSAIQFGVMDYILKPMNISELRKIVMDAKTQLDEKYDSLETTKNERRQMNYVIPLVQKQLLADIILGELKDKDEIAERMKLVGISCDLENSLCCMGMLEAAAYGEYVESNVTYNKDTFYKLVLEYFQNTGEKIRFYVLSHAGGMLEFVAISGRKTETDIFLQDTAAVLDKLKAQMAGSAKLHIEYTITGKAALLLDLGQEERELLRDGKSSFVFLDRQKMLVNYINVGNKTGVLNIFESIMQELGAAKLQTVQNTLINLFSSISATLAEMEIDIFELMGDQSLYRKIIKAETFQEASKIAASALEEIIDGIQGDEQGSSKQFIRKAKQYIAQHACEDINLEDVANVIYLNPVYFSKLFKDQTGENFSDYLIAQRIKKAMELLKNETYKVYEISGMVGYKSVQYFYRIFKQYTGLTPVEYRNQIQ